MTNSQMMKAIVLMLFAAMAFSIMNVLIRLASEQVHAFEIAFFRNLFGLVFMLPWIIREGVVALKTENLKLFGVRALLGLVSMLCFFWGLTVLPLAKAVALSFTVPLFVTIGAAVIFKEPVHLRRWVAVVVGFIGTLVILRPSLGGDLVPSLVVLASSVTMAASVLIIKKLSRTESPQAIVIYMVLMMTPMSLPVAMTVWVWPDPMIWVWLVLLGCMGSIGHLLFTHSLKQSDVSVVMPFDFARLPFIIALAWLVFDQSVDQWTLVGAVIVFGSGVYIARREAMLNKKRATQAKVSL